VSLRRCPCAAALVPLLLLRRHPERSEGSLYFAFVFAFAFAFVFAFVFVFAFAFAFALAVSTGTGTGFGFGFENKVEPPVLFSAGEKVSVLSPRLPHTSPRFHHKNTTLYHPDFPKSPLFTGISLLATTPRKTAAILQKSDPKTMTKSPPANRR
jgi:hypothetical protein